VSLAGIAWGVLAIVYGLGTGKFAWTWGALLAATFWILGIAQGGVVFAAIQQGTQARWGRPLKRIGEAFGFFLPFAWLLLLVFLLPHALGISSIYKWSPVWAFGEPISLVPHSPEAPASKQLWLLGWGGWFFVIRQLGGTALLFALDYVFVRNSLRPDLVLAKQKLGADAPKWWDRIIGDAKDVDALVEKGLAGNYTLVPIMGFAYALIFSMLAFDLVMSLDPWWFSNMFGGWIFMSSVLNGLAVIAIVAVLSLDWLGLRGWVTTNQTHDLGRFMLAGTMFWAYTLFAQILPIYYTDMPEETNFLLVRLMLPQWSWLARLVAILCFLAPFTILLSRGIKKMRWPFMGLALIITTGLFLERSLLIMPAVHLGDDFPTVDFLIINLGIWAGVIGAFVAVVGRVLASVPAVPVSDPLLQPHPWDVHVHSLSQAAHHH